ncbi:MAG: tyrosine--tRNA ligase [Rhodomicrobiaceae bacterium]
MQNETEHHNMKTLSAKSDFLRVTIERGFFHQCSDLEALDTIASTHKHVGYIGFDCTAPSFHIGNLVQIMRLYWLQQTGGKPIALMGGGTTRVGDPSGKDESRKMLTLTQIEENKERLKSIFARFLRFGDNASDAEMVDNAEWLMRLDYLEFLRDIGKHFSVNRMLSMDSVAMRLERQQELSFIEFNYMILQAYDFVELAKRYDCNLQMGGSDQWGNIINGIELGRRMGTHPLYALTSDLITTASGAKMGKSASGSIWLSADLLSPYDYWQFWRNVADADVERFLKLFTILPLDEIARLTDLRDADINEAKKVLATEATALVHGREAAIQASRTARETFEQGLLSETLPTVFVSADALNRGINVLAAFSNEYAKLVTTKSEARRQIKSGGLKINGQPVADVHAILTTKDLTSQNAIKLSLGKKQHVLLRIGSNL